VSPAAAAACGAKCASSQARALDWGEALPDWVRGPLPPAASAEPWATVRVDLDQAVGAERGGVS
jgi:hypothetical protein